MRHGAEKQVDGVAAAVEDEAAVVAPEGGGNFGGQSQQDTKKPAPNNFGGQSVFARGMPTKKTEFAHQKIEERAGWIEFPKKGTKTPKRYAQRRRWIRDGKGGWTKSKPKRLRSIPPMTEEDYVKYKAKEEKRKRAERRIKQRVRKD